MSARRKLNVAFFFGSALLAALIGFALQSLAAFCASLVVLIVLNLYAGDIRMKGR